MNNCPHHSIRYSETWESEYCEDCGFWLETCCEDPDCDCSYRPLNAFDENVEKEDGIDYDIY